MPDTQSFPRGDDPASGRKAPLEDLVGYNLKRAYVVLQADYRATIAADGLSPRVFAALAMVIDRPGITQSALARQLGIERSGLVAIIDSLQDRRYLTRAAVPGDRRVQALYPTPEGENACSAALRDIQSHEARMLEMLTADEQADLLHLLRKIRAGAENS